MHVKFINLLNGKLMHQFRTHTCGQLDKNYVGTTVKLSGWIHRKRDHGNVLFIDLRDHYGLTQIVINPESNLLEQAAEARVESVITITGKVVARSLDTTNKSLSTGEIEVVAESFIIESLSEVLPFQVNSDQELPAEELRLKFRYLDLRREKLHENIILRSQLIDFLRIQMKERGFVEFQTPILTSSSPEGARDFLVPSRLHPGKFYALPQAPQQFKQLLMVSGFDKYFQIAPCFRDEDSRADRSPGEFYQLDIEMSYVTQEDVFSTIEPVLYNCFTKFSNKHVTPTPFPRIKYEDAMLMYGCDKPDLRNPIIISDVTEIFKDSEFAIFANNIKKGHVVRAIPAPMTANQPRSFFDKMITFAQANGAAGLAYITFAEDGSAKGPIAKFLNEQQLDQLKRISKINNGDSVFFSCNIVLEAAKLAGKVRIQLGHELNLLEKDCYKFCWVVDFPFYEINEETGKIDFSHNPFSMPQGGMETLINAKNQEDYLKILAFQYDIVCNGIELSSGAIRNHRPDIMYKAFEIAGYDKEAVQKKFSALIEAFKYGAPPHGGLAPGVDRMIMLLADEPNIREVIAFPLNQKAEDLLMKAPSIVDIKQLRELNIDLSPSIKKEIYK
jgi:aspartyl-tRNA synthetase